MADTPAVSGRKDGGSGGRSGGRATEKRTGPVTFYRQVVAELRKVVWPTRDQLVTYFFIVMSFVLVMIALVTLLDLGLGKLAFALFTAGDDI